MRHSIRSLSVFLLLTLAAQAASAQKVIGEAAKELAGQIAASAEKNQKHKIAVIPFRELDGRTTVLGTYLAEELVTDLFLVGNLEIVERSMLDKVMSELKLSQSGAIDPESAKHVGKIVGVEAIVTGSITDLQSYVGVNCRLIDTETGRIFGAAQTKIVKDADLQKIMSAATPEAAPTQPRASSVPAKTEASLPLKSVDGIAFQLVGCRAKRGRVSCNLLLTNETQEDIGFSLFLAYANYSSVLIDDQSNEYLSTGGSLGREAVDNRAFVTNTLVPAIPVKAEVRFSEVSDGVSGIRLLRVKCQTRHGIFAADFRDVPLTH